MTPVPGHRSVKMSAYAPRLNYSTAEHFIPSRSTREVCLTENINKVYSLHLNDTCMDIFSPNNGRVSVFQHSFGVDESLNPSNVETISYSPDKLTCGSMTNIPHSKTQGDETDYPYLPCLSLFSSSQSHDSNCPIPFHNSENVLRNNSQKLLQRSEKSHSSTKPTESLSSDLNEIESTNKCFPQINEDLGLDNLLESIFFETFLTS